jgi:hypothetical protein
LSIPSIEGLIPAGLLEGRGCLDNISPVTANALGVKDFHRIIQLQDYMLSKLIDAESLLSR